MSSKMDQEVVELREYAKAKGIEEDASDVSVLVDDEFFKRTSRSLVRKLDMTMMPMIWTLYMFNYLDRNNIS